MQFTEITETTEMTKNHGNPRCKPRVPQTTGLAKDGLGANSSAPLVVCVLGLFNPCLAVKVLWVMLQNDGHQARPTSFLGLCCHTSSLTEGVQNLRLMHAPCHCKQPFRPTYLELLPDTDDDLNQLLARLSMRLQARSSECTSSFCPLLRTD